MTREQAINYLISSGFSEEQVSEVVRALTYEPTPKNDLGVDCIDRNYATRLLADIYHNSISDSSLKIYQIINWLNQLPSVTPQEPKTGHWIEHEHNGILHIECSECLSWFLRAHLPRNSYCPNCGADMRGEEV